MNILFILAVLDSLYMLITHHPYGLLNNKAADSSFIGCMLPMIFYKGVNEWKMYASATLMVLAIFFTRSSTGLASIGVGASAILFQTAPKRVWLLSSILGLILLGGIGSAFLGRELVDPSGRQIVWREAWNMAIQAPWFGHGTGSWTIESRKLAGGWLWLHNDYLEVFFENGIVGLMLVLITYCVLLIRLYKRDSVYFAVAVVYGFTALTEMPLRLFVTQILGVCLIFEAFNKEVKKTNEVTDNESFDEYSSRIRREYYVLNASSLPNK